MKVETNRKSIEAALERSIATILPSREAFVAALSSGKRLRLYIGADPTGPDLHLGHATNFLLLERLRRLGHEIIVLFGDFTARIGDPTEKEATRKMLTAKKITENIRTWKKQVGKVLSLNDKKNPVKIMKNSVWLGKLNFSEIIELASAFTVQQMLERDMFAKRLRAGQPIYLHEFLYPLMQGYDSVAMNVDAEVGGTDQLFNMLVGRTLLKKHQDKEKFIIATTLLENARTGKKLMNKSGGGYVAMGAAANEMFGGVMALPDEALVQLFLDCTAVSLQEVGQIEQQLKGGASPRDIKARLAREIVSLYHGEDAAAKAEGEFTRAFREGKPKEFLEISASDSVSVADVADVLLEKRIIKSKSELRRLLKEGAITNLDSNTKMGDDFLKTAPLGKYRIGKHRFIEIK